jgi:ankyrin repeat protein
VDKTHRTAKVVAIMKGTPLVSNRVLEHGLYAAIMNLDRQMVQLLLEHGADPNYACYDLTPLSMVTRRVDESLGRLLIDYGAHPYVFVEKQVVHYSKRRDVINKARYQRAYSAAHYREWLASHYTKDSRGLLDDI